jgi:uncharacterized membrane protein YhiD involved in acid resistance
MNRPLSGIGAGCILATAAGLIVLATPGTALAYVGPGIGAGALAVVLGVIGSILLAVFAIVWYPLKRLFNRRKPQAAAREETDTKSA